MANKKNAFFIWEKNAFFLEEKTRFFGPHDLPQPPYHLFKSKQKNYEKKVSVRCLFVLFASELGLGVGDVNVQGGGSLDDALSLFGADALSDLASPLTVAHHQAVELVDVVDKKFFESEIKRFGVLR